MKMMMPSSVKKLKNIEEKFHLFIEENIEAKIKPNI